MAMHSFSTEKIPVQEFMKMSGVLEDYLSNSEKLKPFVSTFCELEQLQDNINLKQGFSYRRELVNALKEQNVGFEIHKKQVENIDQLAEETTFCITTAHQTNLFGGPLYFIQKAISAIKVCTLAKEKYPKYNFVPVYWLGTEDHDFDELNHTYSFGQRFYWNDYQGGAFGRYSTESLQPLVKELLEQLGKTETDLYLADLLKSYTEYRTIAEGTRFLLNQLLGEHGLIIIDGDSQQLKQLMIPIFQKELLEQFSHKASQKAIQFLETEYGKSQAFAREVNLFYLTENTRKRIIATEDGFQINGTSTTFSHLEMMEELEQNPTKFSPNVMLRPLMQEFCLPNLMYVGGGGELSYWFQLKPIFDAVNVPYPMLGFRDTALYLPKKVQAKISKLNLKIATFSVVKSQLLEQIVKRDTENELHLNEAKELIEKAIQQMEAKATRIDFTLKASAKSLEQKTKNLFTSFEKKMFRAEKKNHQQTLNDLDVIYETIYPNGKLQERHHNFTQYYSEYGKAWIDWQLEAFNLFDQTVKVMKEN